MNEDVKRQWMAALRSGEYEQGYERLKEDGRFCCLGVLCDLAVKAGVVDGWRKKKVTDAVILDSIGATDETDFLPREVQEWAGIDEKNPVVDDGETLTGLNDVEGLSFEEIANIIEEEL